jgi:hypothetical protein
MRLCSIASFIFAFRAWCFDAEPFFNPLYFPLAPIHMQRLNICVRPVSAQRSVISQRQNITPYTTLCANMH